MSYEALLTEGYRRSAQLTWRYGTTYFWGAALLPKPQRKHVHAIYALCRLADDIVDLPNGQAPSRQEPDDLLPEPDDIPPERVEMRPEPVEEREAGNSSGTAHLADYDIPAEPDPTLPELEPTDPAQDQEGAVGVRLMAFAQSFWTFGSLSLFYEQALLSDAVWNETHYRDPKFDKANRR